MARKKTSLDQVLADLAPPERVVSLCLAGDLVAEHQELERELERAQKADLLAGPRLGNVPTAHAVAEQIRDVEDRMRARTHTFRFRSLSRKAWSDLLAEHPDPTGKRIFDPDTFAPAAIAACCVEPDMGDPVQLKSFMELLSTAQFSALFDGAWEANTTNPSVPFSYAASGLLQTSAKNSDTAAP